MRRLFVFTFAVVFGVLAAGLVLAARDSSGTYSRPSGNPVTTGTPISSTWANTLTSDLATEITDSLSRSGKGPMLAPLNLYSGGSAAVPELRWNDDTDTGLYLASDGVIGIATAGTQRASVSSSGVLVNNIGPLSGSTVTVANTLDAATIDRAGTIGIGTTSGTTVTVGRSGQALSLPGSVTTGTLDAATIDRSGTIDIGTTTGTTITVGRTGQALSLPGTVTATNAITAPNIPVTVKLGSDQNNSSDTTWANLTDLSLTLTDATDYEVEWELLVTSAASTTGIAYGLTGTATATYSGLIRHYYSNTTTFSETVATLSDFVTVSDSAGATVLPYSIKGFVRVNGGGTLMPRFRSEVNGSQVTVKAGSYVKYRAL